MVKKITQALMLILAILSATVATGLIAGFSMWPWIVACWIILAIKNLLDAGGG